MINRGHFVQQKCSNCNSCLLDRIGTEIYCLGCETITNQIQEDIQVVPEKYQSNSRNRRELDMERRLNAHIREFTDKYVDISSLSEIGILRQRLRSIKKVTPNAKGTRQAAAIVVYFSLQENIKLNFRQFCKKNNLSLKVFNQKYKAYHKLFKNIEEISHPLLDRNRHQPEELRVVKVQHKVQDGSLPKIQNQVDNEIREREHERSRITSSKRAVEIIFDSIFTNYYLKEKRKMITDKLISKIETVDIVTLQNMKFYENPTIKLYYIIFAVIKSLGHKIDFQKYSQIIKDKTGYLLKRKTATQVKKYYSIFCNQFQKQKEEQLIKVPSLKVEENNTELSKMETPNQLIESQFQYIYQDSLQI